MSYKAEQWPREREQTNVYRLLVLLRCDKVDEDFDCATVDKLFPAWPYLSIWVSKQVNLLLCEMQKHKKHTQKLQKLKKTTIN